MEETRKGGPACPPIARQELQKLLVTDADAFTALRYLRHRENVPSLPDLEEQGRKALPGIEGSLCDLYHTLWAPEPSVKEEVASDRRYWRELLGEAVKSTAYAELHASTQLSELKSVLGTVAMGETVVKTVSKEDAEKLQETATAQREADDAQQEADQAQAAADMAQAMFESANAQAGQGQGSGGSQKDPSTTLRSAQDDSSGGQLQPGQGKPGKRSLDSARDDNSSSTGGRGTLTPEQAKALADALADEWLKAQECAEAANQLAAEAKAKAEALANELLGQPGKQQAEQKLRELARAGQAAIKAAQAKVEEVSETIEAWGLEEAELTRQSIPEALGLLERMKRSAALKKFAALLGRLRKIAARKARSKTQARGVRIAIPETGRDMRRAYPSELVALAHPATRTQALKRWARGELRLRGEQAKQKLGHGPVIVCEDASGSMDGAKQQWAKGVVLSLAHFAKLQKRSFGWIMFDSRVHRAEEYPAGRIAAKQMLDIVESHAGGGTDFERPLRKALEMVKQTGLKKADICFITDGECAVSETFLREFKAAKRELEINVFTILCDVGSSADSTVSEFSDRIETVSSFSAEEAETKVFGSL
ncbi:MAG: VWA domain-containing protein [Patescibacteria group bacterium]